MLPVDDCDANVDTLEFGSLSGSSSAVERELPKLDVAGSIPVSRSTLAMRFLIGVVTLICAAGCGRLFPPPDPVKVRAENRQALFEALKPVKLSNCEFERVGDQHDGGYVICKNLVGRAESLYSYGIAASDNWGCTLSARLKKPVHQYDCFDLNRPPCDGASPIFHEECVGERKATVEGRLFDTVDSHIARNGDAGKRLIMKIDVEGSEWPSFLAMPESALQQIDQLSVEFHGVEEEVFVEVMHKLRRVFHVVNVHYNNWTCHPDTTPLPATTYEVLFVHKGLGVVEAGVPARLPNPFDSPNTPGRPDCQPAPQASSASQP